MTRYVKPRGKVDYTELGFEASIKALLDAHINYDEVEMGVACYCYGDSTSGQRVFYQFGMTQIPIYNVNNNCSTGSTGLQLARSMVAHGASDCFMVIGFEKMNPGSLSNFFNDRESPIGTTDLMQKETRGIAAGPSAPQNLMPVFWADPREVGFGEHATVQELHYVVSCPNNAVIFAENDCLRH